MAVAAGIIANGVTEILKKLSSVVANEITLVWDFNDELENLQSTLNMTLAVMEDAEKKQVSNGAVRLWMEDLKSIAYDAEDILDDYSYEIIRKQTKEVRKPSLFFHWRMAHKIKEINEKFSKIAKRKNDLGLQIIDVGSSSSSHAMMMNNRETYSLVASDWKIVGREDDKSNIINMLLDEEEEENSTNQLGGVSVIPIVGMGGVGKTTMAQQVYNDEAVKRHFDIKVWICVSDPFDVNKVFKNIAKSLDENSIFYDNATMETIVCGFQKHLRGNKFLLVLDDVWNENFEDWHKLKTPLMVGADGSKILVTTRSVKVAQLMQDKCLHYELGILNENDSWSLFKEITFGFNAGAEETPELMKIGEEMVKRCKGLPLAVIFLGSLMRYKKNEKEWKTIQDTKIWHESREGKNSEILPSLRLSYDNLPSHLKLCFSYCCLFPKDWKIEGERLIRLWMAEGFLIESPGENAMSMEEIGYEYFHNLLCNFFFQDVERNNQGDIICKMHDLVHDLARSVVGKNECLIVESADDIGLISETTRRLNLVNLDEYMVPNVLKALKKAKNLRTVLVNKKKLVGLDIGKAISENNRLRVLDLSGSSVATKRPCSIGGLKHLRYLDVKGACFSKGIGRLSFLQTLKEFNVGDKKKKRNASVIQELEGLNFLTGDLSINHLQNVTSGTDACRANLKERKNLRSLKLSGADYEAVLEGLQPHPNLRTLEIEDFQGSKLPGWIQDSLCLPNLVELTLNRGSYEQLAGFGALPSLRFLTLQTLKNLKCIGNELYYTAGREESSISTGSTGEAFPFPFPSLEKLSLLFMPSLNDWVVPPPPPLQSSTRSTTTNYYCFPKLEEVDIWTCPLSTITPVVFPSLKVLGLQIVNGSAAETLLTNNLKSLTSLRLYMIRNLITLPRQGLIENNNTLLSLSIESCGQFEGFLPPNKDDESTSCSSSSLQSLTLYGCAAVKFYPNIRSLTSLRELEIQECNESKCLQDELMTCVSSFSSLKHLEHVKILKKTEEAVFVWRKSSVF